jgi:protein-tyrosine kinase
LVTSGQPGDGKTTTIFNTALAFTQLKSEVLIIDCDLRKPRLHKVAQVEKGRGLSNFLSSGGDLTELIRPTSIPHLSILPSGPVPPNPSELISSNKMKELLVLLQEVYDYILIDSPPLVTVTDPIILSTLVDGVILVAKSGKTKTDVLRRAYHDLATINAKILGVVLNDFNMRRDGYQDYYYYYRYQYDYRETA